MLFVDYFLPPSGLMGAWLGYFLFGITSYTIASIFSNDLWWASSAFVISPFLIVPNYVLAYLLGGHVGAITT